MTIGFAIGNGTSREQFDLEKLRGHGLIVGCNWLVRDFAPDILVSLDREPQKVFSKIPPEQRSWKWLTRNKSNTDIILDDEKVMGVINVNRTRGKNSGIVACSYLGKVARCKKIYMVGFDFFRIHPGMKKHDIYHDRMCAYKNFNIAVNWLAEDCPETEFIRVGPIHPLDEEYFSKMPLFTFIDYPEFEERLKDEKL